ncbi:MAG: sigma-70 family RNA polymerase sigma factor [Pyrinomonadaceae bacterium]|nr:sigma-70 family RNA polymerase sigma factor [Pyrinomonadaceae bacterium]
MENNLEERFANEAMPHLKDIYRTAARLTHSLTEAEDIAQEVFLQAWKSFDKYEAGTNCRAWLYQIMFFKISHFRRSFVMRSKFFQSDDEEGTIFANAAAETPIPQHLTDEDIIKAVDKLSPKFRAVVLLADVEEFSYREVAEILQVPIGTVMSRLSRGRKLLRESLSKVAPEYGFKNKAAAFVNQTNLCAAC